MFLNGKYDFLLQKLSIHFEYFFFIEIGVKSVRIYIFTNLLSTSIRGYQKKRPPRQEQEIKYLESPPGGKRKIIIGQKKKKKRKDQPRHTSWKKI